MAKTKKKEVLSLEERLEQALVPVDEQPYEVPENWCWTYLTSGFCECKDSFRKPINASGRAEREGDIPYYGATGQVGWIDDYLTDEQLVLVGEDGAPFLDTIKDKAYMIEGKAWVNNHAHILKSYYGEIGNKFILHYLNSFNYKGYVNGTTRLKLTQASMNTIPVPMPPLAEQQRIVEQIESLLAKLDEAKDKIQNALSSFEIRKKTIISKAVSGELTKKWREYNNVSMLWEDVLFEDVARAVDPHPSHRTPKECFDGIPYVGIRECNYSTYQIDFDMARKVNVEILEEHKQRYCLQEGDFIIGKIGTIGKPFQIPAIQDYALSANVVLIQPIKERINPQFMFYLFQSDEITRQFEEGSKATTQSAFGIQKVRKMSMRIPAILEQEEIVRIMQNVLDGEHRALEVVCGLEEQIELMKKSILAKAFRGELGTNNPAEENAVELLKSILGQEE